MTKEKGVYAMRVQVPVEGKTVKTRIIVDSGAAECVMPKTWFPEIKALPAKKVLSFAGASGDDIGNFGRKMVEFVPLGF